MKYNATKVEIIFLLALILSSCAPNRIIAIEGPPIKGLENLVHADSSVHKKVRTIHIVATHGMGHDGSDEPFTRITGGVKKQLGKMNFKLSPRPTITQNLDKWIIDNSETVKGLDFDLFTENERKAHIVRQKRFFKVYNPSGRHVANLHYYWADFSWLLRLRKKATMTVDQKLWSKHRSHLINQKLKSGLMNYSIADAAAYLNPNNQELIYETTRKFLDDIPINQGTDDKVVLMSISLGSKVLTDTFNRMYEEGQKNNFFDTNSKRAKSLVANIEAIYLFSNQVSLLNLGTGIQKDSLKSLLEKGSNRRTDPIEVVAFSDPSDLLSYYLDKKRLPQNTKVTNVIVSNKSFSLYKLLKNPVGTHGGYLYNDKVLHLTVAGNEE